MTLHTPITAIPLTGMSRAMRTLQQDRATLDNIEHHSRDNAIDACNRIATNPTAPMAERTRARQLREWLKQIRTAQ